MDRHHYGNRLGLAAAAATVALLLPLDLRQAVVDPTVGYVLLARPTRPR